MVFEKFMTYSAALYLVSGVYQLFVKRDNNCEIVPTMDKATDDLLIVVNKADLDKFVDALENIFPIIKSLINYNICFNGFLITE